MNTLWTLVVVLQVVSAIAIVGLVLLQHGKGADMGAAFGSGASGSLFGASGSSNFLSKTTAVAAALFFAATLALAFLGGRQTTVGSGSVMENYKAPATTAPASNAPASQAAPAKPESVPIPANEIPK
ncbi:MAG: secG [Paucimonas sp.]|jgi:preprotein translocase subunit SecG|nr:secG [Paucimonas sp.]